MRQTLILVKTLISICKSKVNFTHFLLEKVIEKTFFFKRPKDCFTVTPCPSKAIVKEEISAVFHNPHTMYWNGSSLNSSVQKSRAAWFKDGTYILKKGCQRSKSKQLFLHRWNASNKKHFFPSNAFLMLASGMMDVHRQVGGSFVDQRRLSCFLPSLSTSG